MPDFSQSFNRYSYCLNNPLKYVDPNGEAWWVIPIIAAAVFATGNTIAHAIRGDIHNFGNGLKYFSQGALTGFALGTVYQFAPAVPWVGNTIRASMNAYLISQAGITSAGVMGGAFHGIGGIKRAIKITYGNFYLDENNWLGGVFQGVLRHTWEMPQTLLGHAYTQTMNMFGGVDRVDYLGGATFATNENAGKSDGVTFGNFININNRDKIEGNFDEYIRDHPIYMHEYGHTIDSHLWGVSYLLSIGVPSLYSASSKSDDGHRGYWTETRANRRAAKYFGKYYGVTWNSWRSPEYYLH